MDRGWVEYYWDKPGSAVPSRKISYALSADVSFKVGIQVAAGIYDDKATPEQLDELLVKMSDPAKFPPP
jgi:signal transduction histidine kinase